ncbi:cephalosporin hydroxylase [Nitrospirillum amazonense]|uniref:Cephalosporin hydroxylase n=1 Tax=Nitrospirillum amazonense TaxID=28077 RepID=A0A560FI78_9PROT|nr:class I SAM-dependent methyltransferase [Nitrospirillum amazonense]TWB21321.1 cephalosporin hydroxylase [Nitrospirillum amazonense]
MTLNLENFLYPNIPTTHWQMQPSERMALTGLLARLRPQVALEIGVFYGGSLNLISQFAERVWALDIDPQVLERFPKPANVDIRIGDSNTMLATMLAELNSQGLTPDFILLDADHSTEGVLRDLQVLLTIRPRAPMVIVMHDSGNPACRQGMLSAPWASNPYVHDLDLDFVPGQIVPGGSGKYEVWGGIGLAYLHPEPRDGDLIIRTTGLATILQLHRATAA